MTCFNDDLDCVGSDFIQGLIEEYSPIRMVSFTLSGPWTFSSLPYNCCQNRESWFQCYVHPFGSCLSLVWASKYSFYLQFTDAFKQNFKYCFNFCLFVWRRWVWQDKYSTIHYFYLFKNICAELGWGLLGFVLFYIMSVTEKFKKKIKWKLFHKSCTSKYRSHGQKTIRYRLI